MHPFILQYVAKNNNVHHQRAIPKRAPVLTIVDERDDSIERKVQRVPTITDTVSQSEDVASEAQPESPTLKPATKDTTATKAVISDETPHVHTESDEAKEARLDRQWKQLKLDTADLPDIYARLSKIKLTGRVHIEQL